MVQAQRDLKKSDGLRCKRKAAEETTVATLGGWPGNARVDVYSALLGQGRESRRLSQLSGAQCFSLARRLQSPLPASITRDQVTLEDQGAFCCRHINCDLARNLLTRTHARAIDPDLLLIGQARVCSLRAQIAVEGRAVGTYKFEHCGVHVELVLAITIGQFWHGLDGHVKHNNVTVLHGSRIGSRAGHVLGNGIDCEGDQGLVCLEVGYRGRLTKRLNEIPTR